MWRGATELTQVLGRHYVDFDEFLWARSGESGHTWVSRPIQDRGTLTVLDNVPLPGLQSGKIAYHARPAIKSNPAASVFFLSGSTTLASVNFGATFGSSATTPIARTGVAVFEQDVSASQQVSMTMEIENIAGGPQAALDWLRAYYPMVPARSEPPLRLHTPLKTAGTFTLTLQGFATEPFVLDITTPGAYTWLGTERVGNDYRIQATSDEILAPRELIAFDAGHVTPLVAAELCPC